MQKGFVSLFYFSRKIPEDSFSNSLVAYKNPNKKRKKEEESFILLFSQVQKYQRLYLLVP